ncbi:MAG TPA: hypothetical protein PLR73_10095 [Acetivibrio sp.]|nr:hypothetical protein [Acetivibrio sp.]
MYKKVEQECQTETQSIEKISIHQTSIIPDDIPKISMQFKRLAIPFSFYNQKFLVITSRISGNSRYNYLCLK